MVFGRAFRYSSVSLPAGAGFCLQLSFFACNEKVGLKSTSTDCKQRSSTVSLKKKASPFVYPQSIYDTFLAPKSTLTCCLVAKTEDRATKRQNRQIPWKKISSIKWPAVAAILMTLILSTFSSYQVHAYFCQTPFAAWRNKEMVRPIFLVALIFFRNQKHGPSGRPFPRSPIKGFSMGTMQHTLCVCRLPLDVPSAPELRTSRSRTVTPLLRMDNLSLTSGVRRLCPCHRPPPPRHHHCHHHHHHLLLPIVILISFSSSSSSSTSLSSSSTPLSSCLLSSSWS